MNTLWVSPTDPNFVVAGGEILHKSTNGGNDFHQMATGGILTGVHVDFHAIVADPGFNGTTNKRVYIGNDGGVFRTDDITTANTCNDAGWVNLRQTYQTSQFYGAAGHGTTGLIFGGTQDNGGLRLLPNDTNATHSCCGDAMMAAIDPIDDNYLYTEDPNLRIQRSTNRGNSMAQIYHRANANEPGSITDIPRLTTDPTYANWVGPFTLDPNDPNRMLAGGRSLWRNNNVKAAGQPFWTAIRPHGSANLSAVAVAPGNSNIVWIAQNDGKVYKTNNGLDASPTWITIDDNSGSNPFPNRFPTRILIDKDNSNRVYVAFGGFSPDNLWRTDNGGTSWQDVTGSGATGLPNVPIRGVARHPNNSNKIYVGTEIGVFTSDNGGATWLAVLDGPANVSVDELVFMSNSTTLLAATHGRGIWTTDVNVQRNLFDFDGDGRADVSVFRPSNGNWYLSRSTAGFQSVQLGVSSDITAAADYDGDWKTDVAAGDLLLVFGLASTVQTRRCNRCNSVKRATSRFPPISTVTAERTKLFSVP